MGGGRDPASEPGPASPWAKPAYQQRSRDQRDRLLTAGERVFAEKGFWQAHVADIARRAGCSVGSFYSRFQDKEAFFRALQTDMSARGERNIARFFDDPARAAEPMHELFLRLVGNTARGMTRIEGYYRALFELSLRGHDVWAPMRRLEAVQAQRILDLLIARGLATADPDLLARAHLAMRAVNGQILSAMLHGPGPYAIDDPRLVGELALMLVRDLRLAEGDGAG